ncbi:MAG: diphthine--ammonia ligase [Patescibacteria group bacterium]|nr:diphthine--ammonia ligase [Patescibacteria group bacterium]
MCGIIGCFFKSHESFVKNAAKVINYRGIDGLSVVSKKDYSIAHLLHSIVGFVRQPLEDKGNYLIANCEIYNYKELAREHRLVVSNDADLMIKLINKIGLKKAIDSFDGVYAACYIKKSRVYLFRDKLGEKPVWFSKSPFCFASEKKALEINGVKCAVELNPRNLLVYDFKTKKAKLEYLGFLKNETVKSGDWKEKIKQALVDSVRKRIPKGVKVGVLFSGGIDSTLIAYILKTLGVDFTCYTSGIKESEDVNQAINAARLHCFRLNVSYFDQDDVKKDLPQICSIIESNNVVKVGVSIPFFYACKAAKKDKVKVIFSGLGSEEVFAGYKRFESSTNINEECLYGLKQLYERDLYRDDCITMYHNLELRLPFLDHNLINLGLSLPSELKINDSEKKIILRSVAKDLGIDESVYNRKKRAAQYGSRSDKVLEILSKEYLGKSDYLKSVRSISNLRLGVLFSGGKDSNLATFIMKRQNYEISCLITMINEKDYSYMFQKANKEIIKLQSNALNIPAIFGKTVGIKEEELKDLKKLLRKARDKYCLDGIITGALYSSYQRNRIFELCEELNLKVFSPLWHKDQEQELNELLQNNFDFIIVKTAALGLDDKILGKVITKKEVEKLVELRNKWGVNVAGEGGEYESIVLNSPLFNKKIEIIESETVKEDDNYDYLIKKAKLVKK